MGPRRYEMTDVTHADGFDSYNDASGLKKRYDIKRTSLQDQQSIRKAKPIFIYNNGNIKGPLRLCFSRKNYRTFDTLMNEIHTKMHLSTKQKVEHLYCWPSGREARDLSDIEQEGQVAFVCTQKHKSLQADGMSYHGILDGEESRYSSDAYGSGKPSPTSVRSSHASSQRSVTSQPIQIYVIYIKNRANKQMVYCNPNRGFESLLEDIKGTLKMPTPCKALYPVKNTREKVDSLSGLKMVVKSRGYDTFYAVGEEGLVSPRNLSPMRNGYNHYQQKSKNGSSRQNGYHMTNGNSKGRDDYEDHEGRTYRRHPDDPEGNDDSEYTPRNDKYDRRRRESPGKQHDDRKEWRRDGRNDDNRRSQYDDNDNRDAYDDKGRDKHDRRDDRRRDDYDRRDDRGLNDRDRDQRSRYDRERSEERENERNRRDNSRNEKGRNERNGNDSRDRSGDRHDDKWRDSDRGRRDDSRDRKGGNERDRSENRNEDKRRNSRKPSDSNSNRRPSNRDDRNGQRNDDRNNDPGKGNHDYSRENTGSISPTDSEMYQRIDDMKGRKEDYDNAVDF